MAEHRHIPEPGEMVYSPSPSWAPVFFAAGITGIVCGIFAAGFIFSPFIYCAVRLLRSADRRWALRTYLFSLAYLALLFLSMAVDAKL
jgi:protoheme IX farnesyltransferase